MKRLLPIALLLLLVGCMHNVKLVTVSYNVLATSQASYDAAMKSVADLYKQGRISDDAKEKIVTVARTYSEAHNAAVKALDAYNTSGDASDEERLTQQILLANQALIDLLAIVKPYLEE